MKGARGQGLWRGACAALLAAGCATTAGDSAPASPCAGAGEVPCSAPAAPGPAPTGSAAAAPPRAQPAPQPGPAWPPPGTPVPASSAVPTKVVEIGRTLPHGACREIAPIMGSGGGGIWTSSQTKMQNAYGQLRTAAQAAGGDYVLIDVVASDSRG